MTWLAEVIFLRRRAALLLCCLLLAGHPVFAKTWLVRQTVGSDTNGGDSKTVTQNGTDGATTNATNNFSSATANFTTGCSGGSCAGRAIFLGAYRAASAWCAISTVSDATHVVLASTGGCTSADNASRTSMTWRIGGAWATFGKALSTVTPVTDGDSVYIGAGTYRESVTISQGAGTSTAISYIGDQDGVQTGDIGEVKVTNKTSDFNGTANTSPIIINGKGFLTFKYLTFENHSNNGSVDASSIGTNITFQYATFISTGTSQNVGITLTASQVMHWLFDSVQFFSMNNCAVCVNAQLNSTADGDIDLTIRNSVFYGRGAFGQVRLAPLGGAGSFKPGGLQMYNNTIFGNATVLLQIPSNWSTTFPALIYNTLYLDTQASNNQFGTTASVLVEDYNYWAISSGSHGTPTVGKHSVLFGTVSIMPLNGYFMRVIGANQRPFLEPMADAPVLGIGNQTGGNAPTTDIRGLPRPNGTMLFGESGTATSGTNTTLVNTNATFPLNGKYVHWQVKITGGTGSGQVKQINSVTATALTVSGNWRTNPDSSSTYVIYQGARANMGKCTAGSTTTCTDSAAAWDTNQWGGWSFRTDGGTGSGQTATVASNTATVLTFNETLTALDNTTTYAIFRGTNENTPAAAAGAYERGNTCFQQTATIHQGSTGLRCFGPATQDFNVPVDSGVSTTIAVWTQWDSAYAGTKPQLAIVNGTECGVADASTTATGGSAGVWEQLTLTFVPTCRGIVTARMQSNSTATVGSAYFDDWTEYPPPAGNADEYSRRGEVPLDTVVPTILRSRPIQ